MNTQTRDYSAMCADVRARLQPGADRHQRMNAVVDAIWRHANQLGVSWVGFYLADESAPHHQRLVLGPRQNRPACSPIELHGVCGAAHRTKSVQIVRDVAELGPNYVACDPRDRSEIVIPLIDAATGQCWGVLDLDSFETGAFDESDADGLSQVLRAAGLA